MRTLSGSRRSAATIACPAAVLVLLAVTAIGVRRPALAFPAPRSATSGAAASQLAADITSTIAWAAGLVAILGVITLFRLHRRRRDPDQPEYVEILPPTRLDRLITVLVLAAAVTALGVLAWQILRLAETTAPGQPAVHTSPPTAPPSPAPPVMTGGSGSVALLVLGAFAAVAFLAVVAVVGVRVFRSLRRERPRTPAAPATSTALADALARGSRALAEASDDRAAILACYAAMEGVLAQHGVLRGAAQTQGEHVRRVRESRLLPRSLTVLLGLFYRARFSDEPISLAERTTAEHALAEASRWIQEAR